MRSSSRPPTAHHRSWSCLLSSSVGRLAHAALFTLTLVLAGCLPAPSIVEAAPQATLSPSAERANADQLVFSMGLLTAVDAQAVTLTFADGQTETFKIVPQTTIQTQNGDAQRLSDLDIGNMVVVIAREADPTALTIVNGGDTGFHEAGPADIRGHENDACAPCTSEGRP
jgi:hypothetical protein